VGDGEDFVESNPWLETFLAEEVFLLVLDIILLRDVMKPLLERQYLFKKYYYMIFLGLSVVGICHSICNMKNYINGG
jgi:hypothetical protein